MAARWDAMRLRAQRVNMKWFAELVAVEFGGGEPPLSLPGVIDRREEMAAADPTGGSFLTVVELSVWAADWGIPPAPGERLEVNGSVYIVADAYDYGDILNIEMKAHDY
jgi:hypothetical protein